MTDINCSNTTPSSSNREMRGMNETQNDHSDGADQDCMLLLDEATEQSQSRKESINADDHDHCQLRSTASNIISQLVTKILDIFADQSGSVGNIFQGLALMTLLGTILGLAMPKNGSLPTEWYRVVSSIIGYTYFVCWSISFYPQIITNFLRQSTSGLSTDSTILAIVNYICYSLYNAYFYWDESVRKQYKQDHGDDSFIPVQSNDVAFAFHALLINFILLGQVIYYGGPKPSRGTIMISLGVLILSTIYILGTFFKVGGFMFIDFLYMMATIKLILSIMTYLPQILLNYRRKSCIGFNLWNPVLDCSGGVLSLLQLVLDSIDMHDVKDGLLGNFPKLVLALLTLAFDGIFFIQHYVLYPQEPFDGNGEPDDFYSLLEPDVGDGNPLSQSIVSV